MQIPQVPPTEDRELHRFLSALKEAVEVSTGNRGGYRAASITFGALIDLGIITDKQAKDIVSAR